GDGDGTIWMLRRSPRQVERWDSANEQVWLSPQITSIGDIYADLAVDSSGNAYVVGNVPGGVDSFGVVSLEADAATSWTSFHDDEGVLEFALAIAALPTGGVMVAGVTNNDGQNASETDALLTWFGPDGTLMGDFVYDGDKNTDADWFEGVAVGPDGNLVAVGHHRPSGGDYQLWTVKIAF